MYNPPVSFSVSEDVELARIHRLQRHCKHFVERQVHHRRPSHQRLLRGNVTTGNQSLSFGVHSISEPSSICLRYFPDSLENEIPSSWPQPGGGESSFVTGTGSSVVAMISSGVGVDRHPHTNPFELT